MDKSGSARLRLRTDEFSRLLFDEASDGFFLTDTFGHYSAVNRSGHNMLGYPVGALIGMHFRQVIMPHDSDRLTTTWAQIATGSVLQEIWPMVRLDGSIVQLEVSAQLLSNGSVLAVVRDPRGRDEYEQQIQTSEAKLRSILHTAPDTILTAMTLPRQLASAEVDVKAPLSATDGRGTETVLLVEDEVMILRVAKTALERRGYRVLCAGNGVEALELVRTTAARIDILITDVVMPALSGSELAVRVLELRPDVKVLFTSGYAANQLGNQGVLREGVNFIQKPYTFAQLVRRVRELLDKPG